MPPPEIELGQLLNAVADAVIAADGRSRVLYANAAAGRLVGRDHASLIGSSLTDLMPERFRVVHLAGMERYLTTGERRLLGGPPVRVAALHSSGAEIPIELTLTSAEIGGRELFVATLREVRGSVALERRINESHRLEAQYRLMALVAQAHALEPVAGELLASLCEPLGWELGVLWRREQHAPERFEPFGTWSAASVEAAAFFAASRELSGQSGQGIITEVVARAQPLWIQDLTREPRFLRAPQAQRLGLISALVLPVISGAEVVAVIELFSRNVAPPDPELSRTLSLLAGHIGQLVARLDAERKALRNERWLRTLVESIGDAVIATDAMGRVVLQNPVSVGLTGCPDDEARGRPLEEVFRIIHEETREVLETPVRQVLREGRVVALANHTMLLSRDGRQIPIEDTAAPIRDAQGAILGVVLVFRDVAIQRSATRVRSLIAEATEVLNRSLDVEVALSELARLAVPKLADWCAIELGSDPLHTRQLAVAHVDPRKQALAREVRERFPPDPHAPRGVPQVIRTGKTEYVREIPEALLVEAAGDDPERLRLLSQLGLRSYVVVPLRAHGRVLGALSLVNAESGRLFEQEDVHLAEELANRAGTALENALLYREATQASRLRDEFLATLSHELRTPLTSILGWTQMLRTGHHRPDSVPKALETIERNTRSLRRLVEDLLDVSRAIRGKLVLERRPVALSQVVESAANTIRPAAEARGVALRVELPRTVPTLHADAERLEQVIWNLLSNAVKFSHGGGEVRLTVTQEADAALIQVRDQGDGIDPDFLPYVFDRFRQADATATRVHGGLGLGLALVKHLVEQHGGAVQAHSDGPGRGAVFTVRLPLITHPDAAAASNG